MRSVIVLAALASLATALIASPDHQTPPTDYSVDEGNNTLEARADPVWPGWYECKQKAFRQPCAWTPTGGKGALDCLRFKFSGGSLDPDISFGPDKGVTCKLYTGTACEILTPPLIVEHPGGDLLAIGRKAGSFPPDTLEGFWSFRCRSWQQKEDDAAQSKYIPLPKKP